MTPSPWPRIPYAEAMRKYGSDKPDLRNPIVMQDVSEHFRGSGFKVFARLFESAEERSLGDPGAGRRPAHLRRPDEFLGAGRGPAGPRLHPVLRPRAGRDDARRRPARRPASAGAGRSPTTSARSASRRSAPQLGLKAGDAAFFVAGDPDKFAKFAGLARTKLGQELKLVDENRFEFAWIVDFPMFEWNEDEKKIDFSHNPFSMPQGGLEALQTRIR